VRRPIFLNTMGLQILSQFRFNYGRQTCVAETVRVKHYCLSRFCQDTNLLRKSRRWAAVHTRGLSVRLHPFMYMRREHAITDNVVRQTDLRMAHVDMVLQLTVARPGPASMHACSVPVGMDCDASRAQPSWVRDRASARPKSSHNLSGRNDSH
jgi:hypothetical protein